MIKKTLTSLTALCMTFCLLCACGEETPLLTGDDYVLEADTGRTARGVGIGDGAKAFTEAYGSFPVLSAMPEADYQFLPADQIPYDTVRTTILPTFFIDGLPVDTEQFCQDKEIDKTEFLSYIRGASYLASHKVIYRYLVFTWEEGAITDIRSESMDYNLDAAYYDAN